MDEVEETAQEISERMLEKELEKFADAKDIYLREALVLKGAISTLKKQQETLKTDNVEEERILRNQITGLTKTRATLSIGVSALRAKKNRVIEELDAQIVDKQGKREEIMIDHQKLKDIIDGKLVGLTVKEKEHAEKLTELNTASENLVQQEGERDVRTKTALNEIENNIHALKKQVVIAQADGNTLRELIGQKNIVLKNIEEQSIKLDEKLVKTQDIEKIRTDLGGRERVLEEREEKVKSKEEDVKNLEKTQQEERRDLTTKEQALRVRARKLLQSEKQLKEAQDVED